MTDENFITDPSEIPAETIVQRIIENAAHAGADLDEVAEYVKIAQREKADSSALNSIEEWLGFAMTEVENIGRLAEALAQR